MSQVPAAQDSPVQGWVGGWVDFLQGTLPAVFLVVVLAAGILLVVRPRGKKGKGGGLRKALAFGIGAALVYLLLTNVDVFADYFGGELPLISVACRTLLWRATPGAGPGSFASARALQAGPVPGSRNGPGRHQPARRGRPGRTTEARPRAPQTPVTRGRAPKWRRRRCCRC